VHDSVDAQGPDRFRIVFVLVLHDPRRRTDEREREHPSQCVKTNRDKETGSGRCYSASFEARRPLLDTERIGRARGATGGLRRAASPAGENPVVQALLRLGSDATNPDAGPPVVNFIATPCTACRLRTVGRGRLLVSIVLVAATTMLSSTSVRAEPADDKGGCVGWITGCSDRWLGVQDEVAEDPSAGACYGTGISAGLGAGAGAVVVGGGCASLLALNGTFAPADGYTGIARGVAICFFLPASALVGAVLGAGVGLVVGLVLNAPSDQPRTNGETKLAPPVTRAAMAY
jgi:hypothetical protein